MRPSFLNRILLYPADIFPLASLVSLAAIIHLVPSVIFIAVLVWWGSNTTAHFHIHNPILKNKGWNKYFSFFLGLLLSIPQEYWKQAHLAHHAEKKLKLNVNQQLIIQSSGILMLWSFWILTQPDFFLFIFIPGYLIGLLLCQLHGYFEHIRGTVSHYSWLYNLIFFNDGYHVEHHLHAKKHWSQLAEERLSQVPSRYPAPFRFIEFLRP